MLQAFAQPRHLRTVALRKVEPFIAHPFVEREDALRESERLYRAISETIDYGVWVCAPDGRNVYASESFLRPTRRTGTRNPSKCL